MTDADYHPIKFEAVKTSISQSKDGIILRLAVHPHECPPELFRSWVGSRFAVVMVELGDDDRPKVDEERLQRDRLVKSAGMLCRDEMFQQYCDTHYITNGNSPLPNSEERAARFLRDKLGIASRAELATNDEAMKRFIELRNDFLIWRRNNNV